MYDELVQLSYRFLREVFRYPRPQAWPMPKSPFSEVVGKPFG